MHSTAHPPSSYLPALQPISSAGDLGPFIRTLADVYKPSNVIVDLTLTSEEEDEARAPEDDEFEASFVRGWLGRVVSLGSKALVRDEDDRWETVVDEAASLLADLSGHCAAGSSTRTYLLPAPAIPPSDLDDTRQGQPPPPAPRPFPLSIRNTTLLASSTGFRTWGSAPLLSRRIAAHPLKYLPQSAIDAPLRLLELGSGTGLVGLTAAAALARLGQPATIELTDYEEAVLDNLEHNVASNTATLGSTSVNVKRLDWSDYLDGGLTQEPASRFDAILGADLVYEAQHTELIYATVAALLRFPCDLSPNPVFNLVLPLRSTHAQEHNGFDKAFSTAGDAADSRTRVDEKGCRWRLVAVERSNARGEDGFGRAKDRGQEGRVTKYWVYRIEWKRLQ